MAVDPSILYLVSAAIVVITIFVITKFFGGDSKKEAAPPPRARENAPAARARENVPPGARARRRLVRRRGLQVAEDDSDDEAAFGGGAGGGGGEEDDLLDDINLPEGKVGAKKLRKLQDKAEKKRQREIELQEREEKKERDKKLEAQRKKEDDRRKADEAVEAEETKKRKEEEEKREHEEYLKMKEMFSVEEEGETEQGGDLESESLLQQFINYIKEMKVVMLEDLAAHFKIRTQDCIDRIQTLQEEGSLTGVIDDRGKFIYITMEELESVAKYIRQLGRVSIIDLAKSSNRLINLNPDNADIQKKLIVGDIEVEDINLDEVETDAS